MESIYMKLRCGQAYFNIHRTPTEWYASLYGQLPIPFDDDIIKTSNPIDLIITITLRHCRPGIPLEIYDENTKTWSHF